MNLQVISFARRAVGLIGIALFVVLVGFSLLTHLAPAAGRQLYIIGGGSMEPTIPLGSLIIVTPVDIRTITVGAVITLRAPNGVVVTHRVIRVVDMEGGRFFETKGDANNSADGELVPARAVIGAADGLLPYAGYLQAFLSTIAGLVATFSVLGLLLLVYLFLAMRDTSESKAAPDAGPVSALQ